MPIRVICLNYMSLLIKDEIMEIYHLEIFDIQLCWRYLSVNDILKPSYYG